ncbi:hypothetical protein HID58_002373 [Brassica napus]|uniref:Zinc knuckle CX2CX4HX4C domain-containing protein n=1 Tax=Brassica napus TaxID=3708 RepID=A0ABQ8EM20_BRANA|nr:hypothetical protein HID58_002373 [Brassica napus]
MSKSTSRMGRDGSSSSAREGRTKLAVYTKSDRIQISVNIDKPLQFERTVGFPNGDTGRVNFLYVGLHRYCFTCKMISHDENSCPELTEEQREHKRLQRLTANNHGSQRQLLPPGADYDRRSNGKRPRSPTLELSRSHLPVSFTLMLSMGGIRAMAVSKILRDTRKRGVEHRKYGSPQRSGDNATGRNKPRSPRDSPLRQAVWNRLERQAPLHRTRGNVSNSDYLYPGRKYGVKDQYHENAEGGRSSKRTRSFKDSRMQEWRPRESQTPNINRSQNTRDDRAYLPRATSYENQTPRRVEQDREDSQRTISEQPGAMVSRENPRSGHLVLHKNETEEEKRRRLKGKGIMNAADRTPQSKDKAAASSAILIGRNTIIIREPTDGISSQQNPQGSYQRRDSRVIRRLEEGEIQNVEFLPSLSILPSHGNNLTAHVTTDVGEDGMLTEEQANLFPMTEEEEAEVDKMVSESDGVMMDENMMENDDLLVDEPGFNAEKIDAISQLSPMNIQEDFTEERGAKNHEQTDVEMVHVPNKTTENRGGHYQNCLELSSEGLEPTRGPLKKKLATNSEVKGVRASRNCPYYRFEKNMKKTGFCSCFLLV